MISLFNYNKDEDMNINATAIISLEFFKVLIFAEQIRIIRDT